MIRPMLDGATAMACAACALFFLRFWRTTRDRLFVFFSLAFLVLALNRVVFGIRGVEQELHASVYLIRLFAFLLILYGIWDKNRRP